LLKALGKKLLELKDEFIPSRTTPVQPRQMARIDIEGGKAPLVFASKGTGELPNSHVYVDGAVEKISKGGSFVWSAHCVPLEGAAVHINAFNFPVWGMLEKLAPAILAGVPVIVKPATATAYLAERVVQRIIESEILPAGTLQFIAGSLGNLFDHLNCQDFVSFTGSASTAQRLKSHPAVMRHAVRFVAETDSLNSSILAPDVRPGMAEFDLFIKEVAADDGQGR
jgi:oxepin-CoA hydrolase/3-oxo-5,6-dehydrosuberyl-CoA semialdehyde dehydrogenase